MTEMFKGDDRARARAIKAQVGMEEALELLVSEAGGEGRLACPSCSLGELAVDARADKVRCEGSRLLGRPGCGFQGDQIALVMAAKGLSFRAACAWLEERAGRPPERCGETLEMFDQ